MAQEEVNIAKGLGRGIELAESLRNTKPADNLISGIFNGSPSIEGTKWSKPSSCEKRKRDKFVNDISRFLVNDVDPYSIDNDASIPLEVFQKMAELGFYGLKTPEEYDGLELSNTSYLDGLGYAAGWSSAIYIVLSAHNTIGCSYPVSHYGTEEQKEKFLPEFAKWPTAFALTERDAGSDISNIKAHAVRVREGNRITGYRIFAEDAGQKWYTTNIILKDGVPLARYAAVIARIVHHRDEVEKEKDPKKFCYGLFYVPTDSKGFIVGDKNTFIGMHGIPNANPILKDVYVPAFNLIGEKNEDLEMEKGWGPREGSGVKIALESLNPGRIAIAKGCLGAAKQAYFLTKWWAKKRNQSGPLSDKEEVREMIAYATSSILAMEAMINYASQCFDEGRDVRVEAAAVKWFASERAWQIQDNFAQLRGGRFFETWQSLSKRELTPPDEAMWVSARPSRIFEGSNDILHQFIFREGAYKYIKSGLPFVSQNSSVLKKIRASITLTRRYVSNIQIWSPENLICHEALAGRNSKRLARKIIEKSAKYRNEMKFKQLMIKRLSKIAVNLGAILLVQSYASQLEEENPGQDCLSLADIFCSATRREVIQLFKDLDCNDDEYRVEVAKRLLNGSSDKVLLDGIIPMTEEHMRGPKNN